MEDCVDVKIERKVRNELKELKGDSSYNTFIKILLKRNKILKRMVNNPNERDFLLANYRELFEVSEYFAK